MSLAYPIDVRAIAVLRAGVVARDLCRRGQRGEVAAMFERSFYLRIGDDFICIGKPSIGNGPTTLIVAACVAALDVRQGARAFISSERIAIGGLLFDLTECKTWHAPPWPQASSPAALNAARAQIIRAATESPQGSLAHAVFASADTPLTRLARPRVAKFAAWISGALHKRPPPLTPPHHSLREWGEGNLEACAAALVGLGPGLTPSGDDFLVGALAALDALGQTNIRAVLGRAVVAAAGRTSPLSASLLRAAAAGHVSENLHTMVAALVTGDADAAMATAARIGHTSGFDALAGAVVTLSGDPSRTMLDDGSLRLGANPPYDYRC